MWLGMIFNAWVGGNVRQSKNFERASFFAGDDTASFVGRVGARVRHQLRKLGRCENKRIRWIVGSFHRWIVGLFRRWIVGAFHLPCVAVCLTRMNNSHDFTTEHTENTRETSVNSDLCGEQIVDSVTSVNN